MVAMLAAAVSACTSTPPDAEATTTAPMAQAPTVRGTSAPLVVREGDGAMFSVTAAGAEPVRYQWQRNGVNIAGATRQYYVVSVATLGDDGGDYSVRISNQHGVELAAVGQLHVVGRDTEMPWM
jgi:hypothetical protein